MTNLPRPGFLPVDDYLRQPREHQAWLLKPLIPVGGAALIFAAPKQGKALALDTPLLTPDGWRTIADINPGDRVYGSDGKPIPVLAISPISDNRCCYRVCFDDGEAITVDAAHEWTVISRLGDLPITLTTQAMLDRGITIKERYLRPRWRVILPQAIDFGSTAELPFDPYCFGLWLGDGTASNSQYTTADTELVDAWSHAGWKVTKQPSNDYGYGIAGLAAKLKEMGVLNNKHIPQSYLEASISDRLSLLAGLLDTDGWANKGVAEFYNTNKRLAQQVYDLSVQLGLKTTIHQKTATLYGKDCGLTYTVNIRAHLPVFRLTRKAQNFVLNQERYRTIVAIEPAASVPVKCLVVDAPDHLFLVGRNCIPTHNSYLATQLALALNGQTPDWLGFPVMKTGKVLYLQLDTPRSIWGKRFEDMLHVGKLKYDSSLLLLADRDSVEYFPFDILQPAHMKYLASIVAVHQPIAVIIDTLREVHSGDEDTSTTSRNVISNLVGATHPAALIIISHSRKNNPEAEKSIMDDHRGSSYITGRMDAILRLTKNRLYFAGRGIEEGNIKIERMENGLWAPKVDAAEDAALAKVLADPALPTLRAKARAFATLVAMNEETAMSRLRRHVSKPIVERNGDTVNLETGEVVTADGVQRSAVDNSTPLVLDSALPGTTQ